MGLFDKLTGTRRPAPGTAPRSAAEVRAALLALDGPDAPFFLREGTAKEGAQLVAVWRLPRGGPHPVRGHTLLRLDARAREVRTLDERWERLEPGERSFDGGNLKRIRGPVNSFSQQWTFERGPNGRRRMVPESGFSSAAVKAPLREAVLAAGWTWRGVFRL
ncbi:hypothetical protein [Streptomyces sp. NRRL F-2580]|uniref:hypothetical protein n=1 Tax=Streptomyces sp. NRRL F-2580 TaxID=1463841 RepID=UPI0004CAC1BF|nr:hypothetical protein [Streptomyces sp. NRRL F-2580]